MALVLWTGVAVAIEHEPAPPGLAGRADVIPDSVRFDQEIANGNAIAMTMTNYGFYGNNFFRRDAVLRVPGQPRLRAPGPRRAVGRGAGHGRLRRVHRRDDRHRGRVPGAEQHGRERVDAGRPGHPQALHAAHEPVLRSRSGRSASWTSSPTSTTSARCQVANSEVHRPMGVEVRHESYQWNFAEFQNILFVHLKVTNRGPLLKNVWVGFVTEFASGCKKCYVNWPPSASDPSGTGGWFDKKWIAFDDSLRCCASTTAWVRAAPGRPGERLQRRARALLDRAQATWARAAWPRTRRPAGSRSRRGAGPPAARSATRTSSATRS